MLKQAFFAAIAVTFCAAPAMAKVEKPKAFLCCDETTQEEDEGQKVTPCAFEDQEEELAGPEARKKKCPKCPNSSYRFVNISDDEVVLEEDDVAVEDEVVLEEETQAFFTLIGDDKKEDDVPLNLKHICQV